jgi:hypothetical protein
MQNSQEDNVDDEPQLRRILHHGRRKHQVGQELDIPYRRPRAFEQPQMTCSHLLPYGKIGLNLQLALSSITTSA